MQKIMPPPAILKSILASIGLHIMLFPMALAGEPDISILNGTEFTVATTKIERIQHSNAVKIILSDKGEVEKNRDHMVLKLKDGYRIMSQYQMDTDNPQKTLYSAVIEIDSTHKVANVKGTLTTAFPVALSLLNHEHPDIRVLRLRHIEGSIDTADSLAITMQKVRNFGYVTYMKNGDYVISGGANLFYAGRYRFVEQGVRIGVHSHGDPDGNTIQNNQYDHYRELYKKMGIVAELYDFERTISYKDMHFLNRDEMIKYNVINVASKAELEKFLNTKLP